MYSVHFKIRALGKVQMMNEKLLAHITELSIDLCTYMNNLWPFELRMYIAIQ